MGWETEPRFKGSYKPADAARIDFANINGELVFAQNDEPCTIDQLTLSESDQLNLISRAVYQQAQYGYDPDSGVKAAAAHVVRDASGKERVFVASNANSRSRQQRPHAEVNALVLAKNAIAGQDFKIKKTYLALYNPDPNANNSIPATPCGHCREDLTDTKFVDENAELYCLPSFNPDRLPKPMPEITLSESPDICEAKDNKAFKMKTMDMARKPLPISATEAEDINYWKDQMKKGIAYAKAPEKEVPFRLVSIEQPIRDEMARLAETGNSSRLLHLEGAQGTLPRINRQLANMIKTACQQNAGSLDQLHKVRSCLVIRENGEVYGGTYVDIRTHSAKPQSEVMALGNALNVKDIKEIYLMEMDENYINKWSANPEPPRLKMPYPEALDGILKNSHCPDVPPSRTPDSVIGAAKHSRCMIHAIALNNSDMTEEKLKQGMASAPIEHLLTSPFQAPSMHQGRGVAGADIAKGCC